VFALAHSVIRWCSRLLLCLAAVSVFAPGLTAQVGPAAPTGLDITPDGGTAGNVPLGPGSVEFIAHNGLITSATYSFACSKSGGVICGSVVPSSATIPAGGNRVVEVSFTATAGGPATITLTATPSGETGFVNLNIQVEGPPILSLRNHNGESHDRSLCLSAGAGEGAFVQCGDLVVTHELPGYATMGRERSLTLLYNSRTAVPRPIVTAAVRQPTSIITPNSVQAELFVGGVSRTTATYGTWFNATRQIAISYDAAAANHDTGVYPFTLKIRNVYASSIKEAIVLGNLIVVNRTKTNLGVGVGMAGVERLFLNQPVGQPDGSILWVGGDGSAKLYRPVPNVANKWAAPLGTYQDTLVFSNNEYTRTLRHGVQVTFFNTGRHKRTTNRAGQVTTFVYQDTLLTSIVVPPGGSSATYTLAYTTAGILDSIGDPTQRGVNVTVTGGRLVTLRDPDDYTTTWGYASGIHTLTSRTNRQGAITRFEYQSGKRVTKVTIPIGRRAGDPATAVTTLKPWDEEGLAGLTTGAVDTGKVHTTVLGPRYPGVADTAAFWLDKWGAPVKIIDAVSPTPGITTIFRGSALVPALPTRVRFPDGRIDSMVYDARGNLTKLIDSTKHTANPLPQSVTLWEYLDGNTKDSPSKVTDPEGVSTRYAYNSMGLTSQVTTPNLHVTKFAYHPASPPDSVRGLLKAVTELSVPVWDSVSKTEVTDSLHTGFGFNKLGNVVSDTSPMRLVRRLVRDPKQRVGEMYDPAGHRTLFTYDSLNRLVKTIQAVNQAGTPASRYPAELGSLPLETVNTYDIDVLERVADPRSVKGEYVYDLAKRLIGETDEAGRTDSTWYDAGGLLIATKSRSGDSVSYDYDAAGRRKQIVWPQHGVIPGGSAQFTYDIMGRMLTATTQSKSLTRTYYGTGAVRTDVQDGTATVLVTQAYGYDRAGRRTWHRIGPVNDLLTADSISYEYDLVPGDLRSISVRWRKKSASDPTVSDNVSFTFDALGRRDRLQYSNGAEVKFAYDKDSRLRLLCGIHPGGTTNGNVLTMTDLREWIDEDGMTRQTRNNGVSGCGTSGFITVTNNKYNWRHAMLVRTVGSRTDSWAYDKSGNIQSSVIDGELFEDVMFSLSNRLRTHESVIGNYHTQYEYDAAGSRSKETPCFSTGGCDDTALGRRDYFYDGLGRMAGSYERGCTQWDGASSSCQIVGDFATSRCGYDALGRMTAPCEIGSPSLGFDNENVIRTGRDAAQDAWTFVHGPGTDDPLLGYYPFNQLYAFFITDGEGRQYAVANRSGSDIQNSNDYNSKGGKYAGGVKNGTSFGAERHQSNSQMGLSFYRNRAYDQETGRWTQEDPIGVAGGINLYQFNGNNPAAYTDPFGLAKCGFGRIGALVCAVAEYAGAIAGARSGFDKRFEKFGSILNAPGREAGSASQGVASDLLTKQGFSATNPPGGSGPPSKRLIEPSSGGSLEGGVEFLVAATPVIAMTGGLVGTVAAAVAAVADLFPGAEPGNNPVRCRVERCDGAQGTTAPAGGSVDAR
jgi:RHS repeat-associated protein